MSKQILVAGDVCLDVIGVPLPAPAEVPGIASENWRLTGEIRTHFRTGGAMLLADFIRASLPPAAQGNVFGPQPKKPPALAGPATPQGFTPKQFLEIAGRLTRDEIVHSLLKAELFPADVDAKKRTVLRVEQEHGYSGPLNGDPQLEIWYNPAADAAPLLVLDDTGNRFRQRDTAANHWPRVLRRNGGRVDPRAVVVYKLHPPLPEQNTPNRLWQAAANKFPRHRLVIVSVDDFRKAGAPISAGLSWERTALDVVWHLLNGEKFAELRSCPLLVIRLGLDGAILWQCRERRETKPRRGSAASAAAKGTPAGCEYEAHLVYDPKGIEGSFATGFPGGMVGCGSAFTAALVRQLAIATTEVVPDLTDNPKEAAAARAARDFLIDGIRAGLVASRQVLKVGLGPKRDNPRYPTSEPFHPSTEKERKTFARQPIPIIPDLLEPDRGFWRLLNDIFRDEPALLDEAVAMTATARKPSHAPGDPSTPADALLRQVPVASFGKLDTRDRREIEYYRSLYTLLRDYLAAPSPSRPLSLAVFGPPGAGKSFGVKEVAAALKSLPGCKQVETLTFNLSLLQGPEDLAAAFHLVRDVSLRGKVPLVFFDEFDTKLKGEPLGWLRCFLAPMQDAAFLDRGTPHPIGPAIFVFAGGTCDTYREFQEHRGLGDDAKFKAAKGPDFLSRLRATLDIPSLNFAMASGPWPTRGNADPASVIPPNSFDAYGPADALPCAAAILLRRASILKHLLQTTAPGLVNADESLRVDPAVLRALLRLPSFAHGSRSFEALIDMSHLTDAAKFLPCLLPANFQIPLHADDVQLRRLMGAETPYTPDDRWIVAEEIHAYYLEQRTLKGERDPNNPAHREWKDPKFTQQQTNLDQAAEIPRRLFSLGLWFRKVPGRPEDVQLLELAEEEIEGAARQEHDRWVAERRSKGYVYGPVRDHVRLIHPSLLPWNDLPDGERDKDREAIRGIPSCLAKANYEVIRLRVLR